MTKQYGRWNNANFYPNCDRLGGKLSEYSTEKMLYGDAMEIQVRNYFCKDYMTLGSFEQHILLRVAASHGLTRNQLERYLILQGLIFDKETIEDRLYNLVKLGYLSWIKFRRKSDAFEIILYDISGRGISALREEELPHQNPAMEYFANCDLFRYMRTKIVSNQIVLHLLCNHNNLNTFYFQREFKFLNSDGSMIVPLYIQTSKQNYIFEFVGNTRKGKELFQGHMEQLILEKRIFKDNTTLIVVAETFSHMEFLTNAISSYEKRGFGMEVLYSHDSEWFYDLPGNFYVMARAMGQSGLMTVKLI